MRSTHNVSVKVDELAELKTLLLNQQAELNQLKQQLDQQSRKIDSSSRPAIAALTETLSPISSKTSRRRLLKQLGVGAATLAAATTATLITEDTPPAQAASGDFLLLGNSNLASTNTYLSQAGGNPSNGVLLWLDWNATAQSSLPMAPMANGVAIAATGTGIGAYFQGSSAPILLAPGGTTGGPSGTHNPGELYVDNVGDLYLYKNTTVGWVKVNQTQITGTYPNLQSATPGTADTGHIHVSGTVRGDGSGGVGGYFQGSTAPVLLVPGGTAGGPGGTHNSGELYVDNQGDLYLYKNSSVGWVKVNNQSITGNYVTRQGGWPGGVESGYMNISGNIETGGCIRSNATATVCYSGVGLEMGYYTPDSHSYIYSFDRTNGVGKPLPFYASSTSFSGGPVSVNGAFSASSKQFVLPHPHPTKTATHDLRHTCIEGPTRGETLYRFSVTAKLGSEVVVVKLPDYWAFLNENPQVWVSGTDHLGRAFGSLDATLTTLSITCEKPGDYNVLLIGTRKDEAAKAVWDDRGHEKKIGDDWVLPDSSLTPDLTAKDRLKDLARTIRNGGGGVLPIGVKTKASTSTDNQGEGAQGELQSQ